MPSEKIGIKRFPQTVGIDVGCRVIVMMPSEAQLFAADLMITATEVKNGQRDSARATIADLNAASGTLVSKGKDTDR